MALSTLNYKCFYCFETYREIDLDHGTLCEKLAIEGTNIIYKNIVSATLG